VAKVNAVLRFRGQAWVILTYMVPAQAEVDAATGLPVLRQADATSMLLLTDVLEPHHVVHRCDSTCMTSGPGFDDGAHGNLNEYLDNVHFIW